MFNEDIKDLCKECEATVIFEVITEYNYVDPFEGCPEEYTLANCTICGSPAMFYREDPEFFTQFHPDEIYEKIKVWPKENSRSLSFIVPQQVSISHAEATVASKKGLYLSASVMLGRALEATCIDYDPKIKTIYDGLNKMKVDGVISDEMYEWANALRLLRNHGAHAKDIIFDASDIEDGLDFLEAILKIIYDIRPKFERFQSRKKQK